MTAIPATAVEAIDACLPQTQCTQCGYPRCRDYAAAIRRGAAGINQCPPGGDITITALARLTGQPVAPLNPAYGVQQPRRVAHIREAECIGCTLCIKACPTDAIVGAGKLMHTVITTECTGCALCVPPCPMDCIDMVPVPEPARPGRWPNYTDAEVTRFRRLAEQRLSRLAQPASHADTPQTLPAPVARRAEIAAAVARARARRNTAPRP